MILICDLLSIAYHLKANATIISGVDCLSFAYRFDFVCLSKIFNLPSIAYHLPIICLHLLRYFLLYESHDERYTSERHILDILSLYIYLMLVPSNIFAQIRPVNFLLHILSLVVTQIILDASNLPLVYDQLNIFMLDGDD